MNKTDRRILNIALPAIVTNITVPLLGLADVAIMGHMGRAAYIGAIAVGSMVFNVMYWLFAFLRMGTSGLTSQALGARRLDETVRLFFVSQGIAMMVALLLIAAQWPLLRLAMAVMAPSAEVEALADTYFHICIWGAPAVLGLYALSGWYIGMQNTRTPLVISVVQNVVNIAASVTLVVALDMKVEGVALGTVIAQWTGFLVALLLCLWHYRRLLRYLRPERLRTLDGLGRFFTVNRDIFLRTLFLVSVNLFVTSFGARQGDTILAVNALLIQTYLFFSYFMDGFAYAGEALCGRMLGAANHRGFVATMQRLFLWGAGVLLLFLAVFGVGGDAIVALLTDEPSVREAAQPYLPWILVMPVCGVVAFLWDGIYIGATATRYMLVATTAGAVLFYALVLVLPVALPSMDANHVLWTAYSGHLLARTVAQSLCARTALKWRK